MSRSVFILTLACLGAAACSQPAPQSGSTGPSAPAAAPSGDQARPPASTPAESTPGREAARAPSTSPPGGAAGPAGTSTPLSSSGAAPPRAAEAPAPTFREVTIPSGTTLSVRLANRLASNTNKVEDAVKGSLSKAVVVDGVTALPAGTQLTGSVLEANESGRVKGRASIAFRFDRLSADGETLRIETATVRREAAPDRKSDVTKGGIGAGVGAIVGGVVGGGKGAAIGAVAGGTGAVLATKGKEVEIPSGTVVSVRLEDPLTVRVAARERER
jgi:hypothetical protein